MAMLRESSTTTATMFCCGFSVVRVNAGCHNSSNNAATSPACKLHNTALRQPRTAPAVALCRLHHSQPNPPAAASTASANTHTGHRARRTHSPLAYADSG